MSCILLLSLLYMSLSEAVNLIFLQLHCKTPSKMSHILWALLVMSQHPLTGHETLHSAHLLAKCSYEIRPRDWHHKKLQFFFPLTLPLLSFWYLHIEEENCPKVRRTEFFPSYLTQVKIFEYAKVVEMQVLPRPDQAGVTQSSLQKENSAHHE